MKQKMSFSDGCHKYGWLIAIAVNIVTMAYFMGGLNQSVLDMKKDIDLLKSQVYDLAHTVRGPLSEDELQHYQVRKNQDLSKQQ